MYLNECMQFKNIESKSDLTEIQKPFEDLNKVNHPVDINVLKSRLREKENIILKKNIFFLVSCLTLIIVAGISVTYL